MAHLVVTLVDILAAVRRADETNGTHTVASLADLARSAILFFVATRLAGGVQADFALKAVLVGVADLHTDIIQTLLSLGTISIDVTLPVAHASFAGMLWWTRTPRAPGWDTDTALLRGWHSSESRWTGTLHILVNYLAKCIWSASAFLRAGVDTLKTDANFIGWAVAVAPASDGADSIATHLSGWALLAGDAGDHAHAFAALFSNQAVVLAAAGYPTLTTLAS